jgi:transposase-like protein
VNGVLRLSIAAARWTVEQKERKKFSREFKLEAIRRTDLGKGVAEVARELEIPAHQLYKWCAELDRKQSDAFS